MDPGKDWSSPFTGDYENRVKSLNEVLIAAERSLNKHVNHKGSHVPKLEDLSSNSSRHNKIKGFRGRNSLFKRPEAPLPRSNKCPIPGYHKNPERWTYYSLEHVADMTDKSNQEAAFAFLKELRQRKIKEAKEQKKIKNKLNLKAIEACPSSSKDEDMDCEDDDKPGNTVVFNKPQKKEEKINKQQAKPEFRNNTLVMPEYEFGTKKVQKKKIQKSSVQNNDKTNSRALKLDHLEMYDNEE